MAENKLNLVGHPYAPIGMGEHIRSTARCLRCVGQSFGLTDIYDLNPPSTDDKAEFGDLISNKAGDVNIYHINGNEIEQSLKHLTSTIGWSGYNIIYPFWELSVYPEVWAKHVDRFDEIWAASDFVYQGLKNACAKPVTYMPMSCELSVTEFYGRRYFKIPETAYVFLFFYDLRSFSSRKNPHAVVDAFRSALSERPFSNAHLVVKVNGADLKPDEFDALKDVLNEFGSHVTLIDQLMTGTEVKNLTRCADCFVSLHRSEGFGLGIAEAMVLGKPVIATAYSGNVDFMDPSVSFGIDYKLIPVKTDEYPHWENQVWAEPDVPQAVQYMIRLLDSPAKGRDFGYSAKKHMQINFSHRKIGLNYLRRIDEINLALQK